MRVQNLLNELDSIGLTSIGTHDVVADPEANPNIAAMAIRRAAKGYQLNKIERDAIKGYAELFEQLLANPSFRARLKDMLKLMNKSKPKNKDNQDVSDS